MYYDLILDYYCYTAHFGQKGNLGKLFERERERNCCKTYIDPYKQGISSPCSRIFQYELHFTSYLVVDCSTLLKGRVAQNHTITNTSRKLN